MKVALIQLSAGENKNSNVEKALRFVKMAARARARFILLPEVFTFRGKITRENLKYIAETVPGETTRLLSGFAKENKVYILAGSILESSGGKKVYNTSVLIDPNGKVRAQYRKMNLFNARLSKIRVKESQNFLGGEKHVLTKVDELRLGMSICYDLRFPELYRQYFDQKAEILTVPSAFTKITGQAHWEILLRARAIENQCYVLAPNQVGSDHRGIVAYGNSMVIDPWGKILARASTNKEEIIYAELDSKEIERIRQVLPLNRRRQKNG